MIKFKVDAVRVGSDGRPYVSDEDGDNWEVVQGLENGQLQPYFVLERPLAMGPSFPSEHILERSEEPTLSPTVGSKVTSTPAKPAKRSTKMKRTKGARLKQAAKTTVKDTGSAMSHALQAAAAVEVVNRLIKEMAERAGPHAPGFAAFASTPVGQAALAVLIPAVIRTGVEMYREGQIDETGEAGVWVNRLQSVADLAFQANVGKVTVQAAGAALGAAGDLIPLFMQAAGEPSLPSQLGAGAPSIDMGRARSRVKVGGEE